MLMQLLIPLCNNLSLSFPLLLFLFLPGPGFSKNQQTRQVRLNRHQALCLTDLTSANSPNQPHSSPRIHHQQHVNALIIQIMLHKLNTCVCILPSNVSCCANCLLACLCLSSKRKDSEPGTKSLLGNAEMMAHHPTDPVEMRRINFQTPGTSLAACRILME